MFLQSAVSSAYKHKCLVNALATKWGLILIKHRLNKIFGNNQRGELKATRPYNRILHYCFVSLGSSSLLPAASQADGFEVSA